MNKIIFKYKFLICFLLVFFIIVTFFISNCFAIEYVHGSDIIEIPDTIDNNYDYGFYLVFWNTESNRYEYIHGWNDPIDYNSHFYIEGTNIYTTTYQFERYTYPYTANGYISSGNNHLFRLDNKEIVYCNFPIYTDSTCSEIFFQNPPRLQLIQAVEVTKIPQKVMETTKKIIPIGLVALSITLLIYLIQLVILRTK